MPNHQTHFSTGNPLRNPRRQLATLLTLSLIITTLAFAPQAQAQETNPPPASSATSSQSTATTQTEPTSTTVVPPSSTTSTPSPTTTSSPTTTIPSKGTTTTLPISAQSSSSARIPQNQVLNYELCEDKGSVPTVIGQRFTFANREFDYRGDLPHGLSFGSSNAEISGTPAEIGSFDIYAWVLIGSATSSEYPITINVTRSESVDADHSIIGNETLDYRLPNPGSCVNDFTMTSHTIDLTANDWITVVPAIDSKGSGKKLVGIVPDVSVDTRLEFSVTGYKRITVGPSSQTRDIPFTYNVVIKIEKDIAPALSIIQPITLNTGIFDLTIPGAQANGSIDYTLSIIGPNEPGINSSNFQMDLLSSSAGYATISGYSTVTRGWSAYTYTATDEDGDNDSSTVFIRVVDPVKFRNTSQTDYSYSVGDNVNEYLPLAIGGASPHTYSLTQIDSNGLPLSGLPEGFLFDRSLVKISGTPTSVISSASFTLTVQDSSTVNIITSDGIVLSNQGKTKKLAINIEVALDLLESDHGRLFTAKVGSHFEHTFFNIGSDPTNYLSYTHSTLPLGLYISPITRSGSLVDNYELVLAGYPSAPSASSSYTLTLTHSSGNTETITFYISVLPNLISITTDDTPSQFDPRIGGICSANKPDIAFVTNNTTYHFTNGYYSNWELPLASIGTGSVTFRIGNNPVPGYSLVFTYGLQLQTISRLDETDTLVHIPVLFGAPTTVRSRDVYICIEVLNGGVVADRVPINLINNTPADQRSS